MTEPETTPPAETPTEPAATPPKRRRWLKVTGLALLLVLLVVVLAPFWSGSIVRGVVVSTANAQLDGTLEIESLSWSYGGRVHLEGLSLADAAGQPAARIASLDASVDLLPALSGNIRAALTIDGLSADLRRLPDGRLNVETIGGPPGEPGGSQAKSKTLPKLAVKFELNDATLRFHGPGGESELRQVEVDFDLAALDQPATFNVSAALQGPGGPAGGVKLSGDVLLAPGGVLRPDAPQLRVDYTLNDLRVEGLAPAAGLFAPAPPVSGHLAGSGHWEWEGGLRIKGQTALTLDGLRVEGAAPGGQALVVPDTQLSAEAQLDASGAGRQTFSLVAGSVLDLHWNGAVAGLSGERPSVEGTLTLNGDLAGLFDLARGPLSLQPGAGVSGALALKSVVRAELSPQGAESVSVQSELGLKNAAARDAQGQPLDLGGLGALQMKLELAAQPLAGKAALDAFELHAGPVELSARGRLEGLPRGGAPLDPAALSVQGGEFSANADLAALLAAVAPLVDLHGLTARGSFTAKGSADGSAGAVTGKANVAVKDLSVQGADGLDVSLPGLVLELGASADAQAVRVQNLELRWEPLRAMAFEVPSGELTALATWNSRDDLLEVPQWKLTCPLVSGEGQLKAKGLTAAKPGAPLQIDTELHLSGQVEPLRAWLAALKPELKPARGEGEWDLTLAVTTAGEHLTAQPMLTLRAVALHGYVVDGQELPLSQADVDFGARLDLDRSGGGSLRADELSLRAPGIELTASATAAGFQLEPQAPTGTLDCQWSLQPDVVTSRLGALLGGMGLAGAPLSGSTKVALQPSGVVASGDLKGAELAVTLPADPVVGTPARTLVQRELSAAFDLTASPWPDVDALEIRRAEFRSSTAQASVEGRIEHVATPADSSADVRFRVDAELERLLADLGPALALPAWDARGAATVQGTLEGDAGRLALSADGTIAKLHMVVPVKPPAGAAAAPSAGKPAAGAAPQPIVIDEPELTFGLTADILVEPLDVTLDRAAITSSFLRGQMSGKLLALRIGPPRLAPLEGDFTYIPDTLGALLSPWLPVQWSGQDEQPLKFRVEGLLADVDPVAVLSGLSADATVGLGQIAAPGLTTGGLMTVENHDGRTHLTGKLTANQGTLDLDADLDLRSAAAGNAPSKFEFKLAGLQVTQELAEVLSRMHPLFAGSAGSQLASVSGALDADLAGTWTGPLPTAEPAEGWAAAASRSLSASGHLDPGTLQFASGALLGDMLSAINLPGSSDLKLSPIDFRIDQGRISYAQPWVLAIAGTETNFTGSVGLDLSLDMLWNVPVTDQLIAKHKFLSSLAGQSIAVPITGSATAPELQWSGALKDLAERAAQSELEKRLQDKLGGLPAIPGLSGGGDAAKAGGAPTLSPEDLLAKADKLWDEGKKADAKPLYQELIDKHKLTLVYALNKKRIKERAES